MNTILANQVKEVTAEFTAILEESLLAIKSGLGMQDTKITLANDHASKLEELNSMRVGRGA